MGLCEVIDDHVWVVRLARQVGARSVMRDVCDFTVHIFAHHVHSLSSNMGFETLLPTKCIWLWISSLHDQVHILGRTARAEEGQQAVLEKELTVPQKPDQKAGADDIQCDEDGFLEEDLEIGV